MPTVPDIHRRGTREDQATLASPPLTVGTLYFVTDEGVTERWDGSAWEIYSGAGTGVIPPPTPGASPSTFLVSGGQVAWESAYTFRVSAASYYINNTPLTSAEDTVTLGAAHATLDRIDVIALDTAGAVVVLPGTAASTPSEPSVDPAAYLKLGIVFVEHATVAPPALDTITVYTENAGAPTEWAWTSSGASIVLNSVTTPHAGTTSIEGTNVVAGVYAQGTAAAPFDPTDYDQVLFFLRSKAAWNSSRGLLVTLRLSGVLVGAAVQIRRSGTFGFDSTVTSDYQMVAIPIVAFAVPQGSTIDQVRVEDFGGAIGFYLDDVSFQVGATSGGGGGLSQAQADARYAPLVHAARHQAGGADPIALDTLAAPTDVTTLNASASAHGLLRKLSGTATDYLDGSGAWSTPAGGGGTGDVVGPAASVDGEIALFDSTTGKLLKRATGTGPVKVTSGVLSAAAIDLSGSEVTGTLASARLATQQKTRAITVVFGTGSAVLTAGQRTYVSCPYTGTITGARLLAVDASVTSGSIVIDVWKDSYANFPPTVADTITASAKPTLSSATKSDDTTLTGWTTAVTAGDVFGFTVDSASLVTQVALQLTIVLS